MGRSQVKYRSTHGRGRGRGRGDAGGRGGASGRGRPSHLRNLGSNAFRFEEKEVEEEQDQTEENYGGRTQFFASEQNYREQLGAAPGEYFQSRTMKQWEEKDDAAEDQPTVGVLDLNWIASQLELVSPDIRYRMDPKYCTDFPFKAQGEEEEVAREKESAATPVVPSESMPAAKPQQDAELDFLLNLSASTPGGAKSTSTQPTPAPATPTSTRTPAETEQLEDWLDDVLDM
ncbi:hypothetical protein PHMEG_00010190 [Phytophthora megakarya]|uniref:Uncharacterized protein n=1 Tax=Phytophthora megakarya TaxID=4795 RepID=A0A225WF93_9STRA|nr:hypothetical protein PHMEG_00010190 [Phytophthora megakarya]